MVSRIGEINTSEAYYIAIFDVDKSNCQVVKNKLEESSLMCKIVTLVMPENQNGKSYIANVCVCKNCKTECFYDHMCKFLLILQETCCLIKIYSIFLTI